jgi:hypothetical protein
MDVQLVREWRERWQRAPESERHYWLALSVVLALGVFVRLRGYLGEPISLWLDEALWAKRFLTQPLLSFGIRPIGFVWLTRTLVHVFGATELWFRFLPNISALVTLTLTPYVASQLVSSRALRVLLVLLVAIHPVLIDFANEFKPYSFEVLVHLVPLALYLRYRETRQSRWFYWLLVSLPIGFLFAYNLAFALPATLLVALHSAWTSPTRRKLVVLTLLCSVVCLGTVAGVYRLALSNVTAKAGAKAVRGQQAPKRGTEEYWGAKYDVFYLDSSSPLIKVYSTKPKAETARKSRALWTLSKNADLAAFVGLRRDLWDEKKVSAAFVSKLGAVDRWVWVVLTVAGLIALGRSRRDVLLLTVGPLLALTLVNALGKWPHGAFRTNAFLAPYLFPLPVLGIELLARGVALRRDLLIGLVALTSILPGFAFGFEWRGHKRLWTRDHYERQIIEQLYELRQRDLRKNPKAKRARLILDLHTHESQEFYLEHHRDFSKRYGSYFQRNFITEEVGSNSLVPRLQKYLKGNAPVWVVSSKESAMAALSTFAETKRVLREVKIKDEHVILILKSD